MNQSVREFDSGRLLETFRGEIRSRRVKGRST
jgi:hypothetical protein